MWKRIAACLVFAALLVIAGGCSGDKDSGKNKNQDKQKMPDDV